MVGKYRDEDIVRYLYNPIANWLCTRLKGGGHVGGLVEFIIKEKPELLLVDQGVFNLVTEFGGLKDSNDVFLLSEWLKENSDTLLSYETGEVILASWFKGIGNTESALGLLENIYIGGGPYEYNRTRFLILYIVCLYELGYYDRAYDSMMELYEISPTSVDYGIAERLARRRGEYIQEGFFREMEKIRNE